MELTATLQDLGLPSAAPLWQALLLTVISFGVGIVGGFGGLALGTVRLPVLLFLGMPSTLAAGTNIIVSTASSLFGALRHMREGRVDLRVVLIMGVPSFAGAFLGRPWRHVVLEVAPDEDHHGDHDAWRDPLSHEDLLSVAPPSGRVEMRG